MQTAKSRALRRVVALLLSTALVVTAAGCTSWKKQRIGAQDILAQSNDMKTMRLTLVDDSRAEIMNPRIESDTLRGVLVRRSLSPGEPLTISQSFGESNIALADIRAVELRKFSAGKTVLFVAFGVGVTAVIVALATQDHSKTNYSPPPSSSGGGGGDGCIFCSCPLLYSWDGSGWVLDSGTFGGAFLSALAYTDVDNLDALVTSSGAVRIRLAAGDQETDHVDQVSLLAVDHDPSVIVAPDLKGELHAVAAPSAPVEARDSRGRDVLHLVTAPDSRYWESSIAARDTSVAEDLRDGITLEFPRATTNVSGRLVVRAHKTPWAAYLMRSFVRAHGSAVSNWYAAMEREPERTAAFRGILEEEVHLRISVWEDGKWVSHGSVWGGGPEIAKTHAIPIDLSGVSGETVRVRLESAPSFWLIDWVALDEAPEPSFTTHDLTATSAIRDDGGDVRPALRARDGDDLVLTTGETVDLTFAAPESPAGAARTYLARTHGWYRFHTPETGLPDAALLDYVLHQPRGVSKMSVAWMNNALATLTLRDGR